MIDLCRRSARPLVTALALVLAVAACAVPGDGAGATVHPSQTGTSTKTTEPSTSATPLPSDPPDSGPVIDATTPTGCITLGPQDCERARAFAATVLKAGDPAVVYVQVGPFSCADGDPCPTSLLTRPEGDVVIEFGGGTGINVHLVVTPDGAFTATRDAAMGIGVPPASPPDGIAGPRAFQLGHCGIFSGIDVDASYWHPVGPIAFDTGEAVNDTTGILTLTDPDHGTFTTAAGFSVRLIRHLGPKLLPFCM